MIKGSNSKEECYFCCANDIDEERIIGKGESKEWYAFIPQDPEIYGHCIVTTKNPEDHCEDILDIKGQIVLNNLVEGVKIVAKMIKGIDPKRIEKVYLAMLGETPKTHMHYHLFPRYRFEHDSEIYKWAEEHKFTNGCYGWRKFYETPTLGFKSFTGFQYLGEIEKLYDETKRRIGDKPSLNLLTEMRDNIKEKGNFRQ